MHVDNAGTSFLLAQIMALPAAVWAVALLWRFVEDATGLMEFTWFVTAAAAGVGVWVAVTVGVGATILYWLAA